MCVCVTNIYYSVFVIWDYCLFWILNKVKTMTNWIMHQKRYRIIEKFGFSVSAIIFPTILLFQSHLPYPSSERFWILHISITLTPPFIIIHSDYGYVLCCTYDPLLNLILFQSWHEFWLSSMHTRTHTKDISENFINFYSIKSTIKGGSENLRNLP